MISWRNLTEKARVINNIVNTIDRKIAIIDLFIFKEIFVVRLEHQAIKGEHDWSVIFKPQSFHFLLPESITPFLSKAMLCYMVATAASSAVNRTHIKETIFLFSSGFGAQRLSFEL